MSRRQVCRQSGRRIRLHKSEYSRNMPPTMIGLAHDRALGTLQGKKTPQQALDAAVSRGNELLRQLQKSNS
jgi:hypothetical protein